MPTNHPFPKADAIRQVLSDLLGRTVTVVAGEPVVLDGDAPVVVSDYQGDDGEIAALCVTDLALSNALGAALTMVPPSSVEEAVRTAKLDEQNLKNLGEVVKVVAQLFDHPECGAVRWSSIHDLPGELPAATASFMLEPLARRDYDITLDEYGTGKLAVLVG